MRRCLPLLVAALAVLAGCADSSTDGAAPVRSPLADESPGAEREAKRVWREPGSTEVAAIDWSSAAEHPRVDPSSLPAEARQRLDSITVPVLLPREPALLGHVTLTSGPTWYAAAFHPEGHHITIHATKLGVHRPALAEEIPPERRRRAGEPEITRTHGIVTVMFEAFGASYTIDVECAAPLEDVRCTEDAYALSVFEELGVAGGVQ